MCRGCFWSVELAYQRVPGVIATSVGYTQGEKKNPTYDEVCGGYTGHTEAVQCIYDDKEVTFDALLDVFFNRVDPTTLNRQGNDRGTQVRITLSFYRVTRLSLSLTSLSAYSPCPEQYRSGIYYHDEAQKEAALKRIAEFNEKLASGAFGAKFAGKSY